MEAQTQAPTITLAEYERKRKHDYAGPGTPLDPSAEGVWWMELDPYHGTTLVTGGRIVGRRS